MRNIWIFVLGLTVYGTANASDLPLPENPAESTVTFLDMILLYGVEINITLMILLFIALFLFIWFILSTRQSATIPYSLVREIQDDLATGDFERATKRAEYDRSLYAQTILPGLKHHSQTQERIRGAMESAGKRLIGKLKQRAVFLSNIATIAPMIGLLGTVLGLLDAFNTIGSTGISEVNRTQQLAVAIGKAVGTTAVGLIVAIPTMALYFLCMSRLGRIGDDLEQASEDVVLAIKDDSESDKTA